MLLLLLLRETEELLDGLFLLLGLSLECCLSGLIANSIEGLLVSLEVDLINNLISITSSPELVHDAWIDGSLVHIRLLIHSSKGLSSSLLVHFTLINEFLLKSRLELLVCGQIDSFVIVSS